MEVHVHMLTVLAVVAAQVITEPPPTDGAVALDVIKGIIDIITNWQALGGLAVAAAAIALVVRLTKLPALARILEANHLTWLRPVLAVLLGAAGAVVATIQRGQASPGDIAAAALSGALAGLTSVGLHEVLRLSSPTERERVRVDEPALTTTVTALEQQVAAGRTAAVVDARVAKAKVEALAELPIAQRVKGLAGLLGTSK